jgi:hypothetical protein
VEDSTQDATFFAALSVARAVFVFALPTEAADTKFMTLFGCFCFFGSLFPRFCPLAITTSDHSVGKEINSFGHLLSSLRVYAQAPEFLREC